MLVVSGQLSFVSCQLSVVSCQWCRGVSEAVASLRASAFAPKYLAIIDKITTQMLRPSCQWSVVICPLSNDE
ncbi:MAG: hypothetical protein U7123_21620 [Potamolinea sp.]